jgi:hypothetical protein
MRKTSKNFKYLITFVFFSILLVSCEKDISDVSQPPGTETVNVSVLGKKLENPYSVKNMQKALNNLLNNLKEGEYEIIPSHYYVKFKPQNDDELSLLKNDTSIYLYQYPLDVEINEGSLTYQDPEVPQGQPTYQYASVPTNYVFTAVAHEILEELFIPEDTTSSKAGLPVPVEDLVTEALRITNNLEPGYNAKASWRPAGTMLVWDTTLEIPVPIKHLKVKARRWFTTYEGITNQSGYYSCNGTFNGSANYSLQFERYDFEIRDGWLSTANINGPKRNFNWNLNMKGGKQEFWATIFRATSHYYYDDIHGLRRPPQNSFWNTQLKLRAMFESNSSNGTHCPSCRFLGLGSAIKIYNPQNFSMDIYGTTIHEIAHASHWKMDSFTYGCQNDDNCAVQCCLGDLKVAESWARGVQWELTRMVYINYTPNYDAVGGSSVPVYTGVVQDMIDGISGYDQVTGYTIRQIEDALPGQLTWNAWKTNIKNLYNNATKENLDALFDFWD